MITSMSSFIIPSDPKLRADLKAVIEDISNQWTIIDGYKAVVKDAVDNASENFEIPKKYIRKLARVYHAQTLLQQQQEMDDLATLYETVIGSE